MIRKVILTAAGVFLVGAVFLGRDVVSYLRTSIGYLKQTVCQTVPMEFQIQRARQMLRDLTPEVQKNMHLIAKEEVEVQRLQSQLDQTGARLGREKQQLTELNRAASSGKEVFPYGGRKYSLEQVKLDLANRFERYKTGEATLASLRQMHTARQRSLEAARQKLEGMLVAKRQLQVEIENIEARNQMVAAAQTTSNYNFDDSRLGRLKELIADLRTRLDVDERLVSAETYCHDEIPVDQPSPDGIVERITKYFESGKPQQEELVRN